MRRIDPIVTDYWEVCQSQAHPFLRSLSMTLTNLDKLRRCREGVHLNSVHSDLAGDNEETKSIAPGCSLLVSVNMSVGRGFERLCLPD